MCDFKIAKVEIKKKKSIPLTDFGNYRELFSAYNPREDYLYGFQKDLTSLNVVTF